eukprot:9480532-Pyramimonas_sp.AAC.2
MPHAACVCVTSRGVFTDEYKKTIGVDFLEKSIYVDGLGEDVRMMLWDTAGQEEFDSMTRTYYRGEAFLSRFRSNTVFDQESQGVSRCYGCDPV